MQCTRDTVLPEAIHGEVIAFSFFFLGMRLIDSEIRPYVLDLFYFILTEHL